MVGRGDLTWLPATSLSLPTLFFLLLTLPWDPQVSLGNNLKALLMSTLLLYAPKLVISCLSRASQQNDPSG